MGEMAWATGRAGVHAEAQGEGTRSVVPAPVGGWNTEDPQAGMKAYYAVEMENFFPERGRVVGRPGYGVYAAAPDNLAVKTLHNHRNGAVDKLFAFTDGAVYDISDPKTILATIPATGVTNGYWRTGLFNGNTIAVNGVDPPLRHDSAGNWVAHGFTGVTDARKLTQVAVHKNRLWFVEADSSTVYYGGLNAVTGALTGLPIGAVSEQGGNCVAIGSISLDTGEGPDDLLAIFMEHGDVVVYGGTDPSTSDTWALKGVYNIGPVSGDRPLVKLGGDLVAVTADGYLRVLQFLQAGRARTDLAVSSKIAPTVSEMVDRYGHLDGWQAVLYTPLRLLLVNIPKGGNESEQHAMNVQSGAWARWTGLDAACWGRYKGLLYFGGYDGRIRQLGMEADDDGTPIRGKVRTAFNYFGTTQDKVLSMMRLHVELQGGAAHIAMAAQTDFDDGVPPLSLGTITQAGTEWGESDAPDTPGDARWNTFEWSSGVATYREWRVVAGTGAAVSVHIETESIRPIAWYSTDVLYTVVKGAVSGRTGSL